MKMIIHIFFIISLVSSITFASVQDFCVADPKGPQSPSGYSCKNPDQVTVNDFVFSGLDKAGNTSNILKAAVTPAFAPAFAGINGLGVSVARLDLADGGFFPLHTHPDASEILVVIQGTICAGFVSSANKVYLKTLQRGDSIVFPQGLLHFLLNCGKGPVVAFGALGSSSPGIQILPYALFANDLPSLAASLNVSVSVVFRCLKEGLLKRHSNAIKPCLKVDNIKARLEFCVSMLDSSTMPDHPKFVNMYNVVHIDEKQFYMTKQKENYYMHPIEEEPHRTCQSKNYIGKVMFLAAMACPRFDREGNEIFSGK